MLYSSTYIIARSQDRQLSGLESVAEVTQATTETLTKIAQGTQDTTVALTKIAQGTQDTTVGAY